MTFGELRKKDVICIGDGRLLGRVTDLEFDASSGQVRALIVPGGAGISCLLHGDRSLIGQFVNVKIVSSNTWALYGEIEKG